MSTDVKRRSTDAVKRIEGSHNPIALSTETDSFGYLSHREPAANLSEQQLIDMFKETPTYNGLSQIQKYFNSPLVSRSTFDKRVLAVLARDDIDADDREYLSHAQTSGYDHLVFTQFKHMVAEEAANGKFNPRVDPTTRRRFNYLEHATQHNEQDANARARIIDKCLKNLDPDITLTDWEQALPTQRLGDNLANQLHHLREAIDSQPMDDPDNDDRRVVRTYQHQTKALARRDTYKPNFNRAEISQPDVVDPVTGECQDPDDPNPVCTSCGAKLRWGTIAPWCTTCTNTLCGLCGNPLRLSKTDTAHPCLSVREVLEHVKVHACKPVCDQSQREIQAKIDREIRLNQPPPEPFDLQFDRST